MQHQFTYEQMFTNQKTRAEFFSLYDSLIRQLKRYGFVEAAIKHAKNRRRIWEEITMLD